MGQYSRSHTVSSVGIGQFFVGGQYSLGLHPLFDSSYWGFARYKYNYLCVSHIDSLILHVYDGCVVRQSCNRSTLCQTHGVPVCYSDDVVDRYRLCKRTNVDSRYEHVACFLT